MKFARPLCAFFAPFLLLVLSAPFAWAHPGHDHNDIPSLIRHPFAGWEHALAVGALLFALVGAVGYVVKTRRASSRHGARARTADVR